MTEYRSINPYSGLTIREYETITDESLEEVLQTSRQHGLSSWAQAALADRLSVLERISELLLEESPTLARLMAEEMGKLVGDGAGEVGLSASIAKYYASHGESLMAPRKYETKLGRAWVSPRPLGVILAVEPWNFPIYQLIRVVAPNILLGNPVLIKPAESVAGCAQALESIVRRAGAPIGAFTVVLADHEQIATLVGDDRVAGVALTGSERAGSAVAELAGHFMKKTVLELGGSDVFIVLEGCDIAGAAEAATVGRLGNSGQGCTSAKRFIVQKSIAPAFLEAVTGRFAAMVPGDPLDPSTTLAPLASSGALATLRTQVAEAIDHGADVVFKGSDIGLPGAFMEPMILGGIDASNPAYRTEFFGPVAQLYIVDHEDEAVRIANDSPYGLGGAVFCDDEERAVAIASRLETGMVFINKMFGSVPELPFGGVKRSGYGRELGDLGAYEFANQQLIMVSESGPTFG